MDQINQTNQNNKEIKQMSIAQIIMYHLLPGVPILLLAIVFANSDWGFGMNITLSIVISIIFALIPVQLLIIAITAKQQGMKFKEIISFTEKISVGKFILWAGAGFLLGGMAFGFIGAMEYSLWGDTFSFMPEWFRLDKFTYEDVINIGTLRFTAVMYLILNGFLGPITEEFYFRGFLLPRMNKLGKAAPLINATLFSVYHLFSPWELVTRIFGVTPLAYAVWRNKNMFLGIAIHCSLNLIGCIGMMVTVFQM